MLTIHIKTETDSEIFETEKVKAIKDERGVKRVDFTGGTCHRRQTVPSTVYVMTDRGDTIAQHHLRGGTDTELLTKQED